MRVVVADQVFDGAMTLRLGKRRIELVDHGRANSPHDVTVWLPDERILFTGDIVVQSPLPYTGMSWPVPWIEVLKKLETVPVAALVPGHGPVMRDHTLHPAGSRAAEAATIAGRGDAAPGEAGGADPGLAAPGGDPAARCRPGTAKELDEDWDYIVRTVIERAWRGVRGQG